MTSEQIPANNSDFTVAEYAAEIIKSLGLVVDDHNDEQVFFNMDGYDCAIDVSEVESEMTIDQLHRRCEMYSCCGDVLDKDRMLCPTCKEHC